ncbi:hypothetical protein HD554DRAFT_2028942 [Boletus coccyginus]|nr:hypothetical protein HD554DRAFT_2028942 [Boletus coccyginus]
MFLSKKLTATSEYIGELKCCVDILLTFHSLKKVYNTENMRLGKTGAGMTYEDLQHDLLKVNNKYIFNTT